MDSININEATFWSKHKSLLNFRYDTQQEILPGIPWGDYNLLFTPAYWKLQYVLYEKLNREITYKLGSNILEEIVACLLGGFGFKSELGLAAFDRLKKSNSLKPNTHFDEIRSHLKTPFTIDNKLVHYRFYNQKAYYIYDFLSREDLSNIPIHNDIQLRKWLMTIKGIGPKTASWITRNYLNSENVAIIDIHIYRAGIISGFISKKLNMQKDYFEIEKSFINFCNAIKVKPSKMDALMWIQMKNSNRIAIQVINNI